MTTTTPTPSPDTTRALALAAELKRLSDVAASPPWTFSKNSICIRQVIEGSPHQGQVIGQMYRKLGADEEFIVFARNNTNAICEMLTALANENARLHEVVARIPNIRRGDQVVGDVFYALEAGEISVGKATECVRAYLTTGITTEYAHAPQEPAAHQIDIRANHRWIREHSTEYHAQYVALLNGTLLAHGDNLRSVINQLKDTDTSNVLFTRVFSDVAQEPSA